MKLIVEPRNSAFCRTRVAWCIPPARKLICPGDYAPYFIMRRYIYIFPPGRKPSPCYQNKDDRTTPPPPSLSSFLLFSFSFFLPLLFHSCAVSIALTPPSNHYTYANLPARSLPSTSLPFFFLPLPRQREILLGERRGIRERIRWSISIFSRAYYLFTIFFEKTFNPPSSRGESRWYDINGLLRYKIS